MTMTKYWSLIMTRLQVLNNILTNYWDWIYNPKRPNSFQFWWEQLTSIVKLPDQPIHVNVHLFIEELYILQEPIFTDSRNVITSLSDTCVTTDPSVSHFITITPPGQCGAGTFASGGVCVQCPKGTYQSSSGQTFCNSCNAGKSTISVGSSSESSCIGSWFYRIMVTVIQCCISRSSNLCIWHFDHYRQTYWFMKLTY